MKGRYVVIEGCDGVGKSTLISKLAELIPDAVVTRHPGSTPLGHICRTLTKYPDNLREQAGGEIKVDAVAAQMLMVVDHIAFISEVLRPALAAGRTVLADRSNFFSGLMYGLAEGTKLEHLNSMLRVVESPIPDAVFILHAPMEVIESRMESRVVTDRFEKRSVRKIVHRLYRNIKEDRDIADTIGTFVPLGRIHHVDATLSTESMAHKILKAIGDAA